MTSRKFGYGTFMKVLLLAGIAIGAVGCSTVEPWEKGNLADYTMKSDRDELSNVMASHVHFSREATAGGEGVGGGGCGCN